MKKKTREERREKVGEIFNDDVNTMKIEAPSRHTVDEILLSFNYA
jgi:hypothetical protein